VNGAVGSLVELAKQILDRPARLGPVRLVVVDGPSGAGKTTFADRLAAAVSAEGVEVAVVHTDELVAGWADQFGFRDRLERLVLAPLRAGRPGGYRAYDWVDGAFGAERTVPVADVLIVEGSAVAHASLRPELTLSVFVDAPETVRLARVLARDGAGVEAPLLRWMAAEQEQFAAQRPEEWVDHLIDAVATVGHHPKSEYVRLPRPGDGHG
jgi:Mrp family chromosome partitioning ATPase